MVFKGKLEDYLLRCKFLLWFNWEISFAELKVAVPIAIGIAITFPFGTSSAELKVAALRNYTLSIESVS